MHRPRSNQISYYYNQRLDFGSSFFHSSNSEKKPLGIGAQEMFDPLHLDYSRDYWALVVRRRIITSQPDDSN